MPRARFVSDIFDTHIFDFCVFIYRGHCIFALPKILSKQITVLLTIFDRIATSKCLLIENPFCKSFAYHLNVYHYHFDVLPSNKIVSEIKAEGERERERWKKRKKNNIHPGQSTSLTSIYFRNLQMLCMCTVYFTSTHFMKRKIFKRQKSIEALVFNNNISLICRYMRLYTCAKWNKIQVN